MNTRSSAKQKIVCTCEDIQATEVLIACNVCATKFHRCAIGLKSDWTRSTSATILIKNYVCRACIKQLITLNDFNVSLGELFDGFQNQLNKMIKENEISTSNMVKECKDNYSMLTSEIDDKSSKIEDLIKTNESLIAKNNLNILEYDKINDKITDLEKTVQETIQDTFVSLRLGLKKRDDEMMDEFKLLNQCKENTQNIQLDDLSIEIIGDMIDKKLVNIMKNLTIKNTDLNDSDVFDLNITNNDQINKSLLQEMRDIDPRIDNMTKKQINKNGNSKKLHFVRMNENEKENDDRSKLGLQTTNDQNMDNNFYINETTNDPYNKKNVQNSHNNNAHINKNNKNQNKNNEEKKVDNAKKHSEKKQVTFKNDNNRKRNVNANNINVNRGRKQFFNADDFELIEKETHFELNGVSKKAIPHRRKDESTKKIPITKKSTYELLYLTKTPTYMNEGELSNYLHSVLNIREHSCHLVVPFNKKRSELKYLNFKIRVLSTDVDLLLRKDSWPYGVFVRKWRTGYERKNNESPPFKPNFRRH